MKPLARTRLPSQRSSAVQVWVAGLVLLIECVSCAAEQRCRPDLTTGMMECITVGSGAGPAVVTGVAGGLLWAVGGGCRIAGCHPPLMCNPSSGLCEPPRCGEGSPECPDGTSCDYNARICR